MKKKCRLHKTFLIESNTYQWWQKTERTAKPACDAVSLNSVYVPVHRVITIAEEKTHHVLWCSVLSPKNSLFRRKVGKIPSPCKIGEHMGSMETKPGQPPTHHSPSPNRLVQGTIISPWKNGKMLSSTAHPLSKKLGIKYIFPTLLFSFVSGSKKYILQHLCWDRTQES